MIEKGLYPFGGSMLKFFVTPIRAFRWKRFFEGVTMIRVDVVNLFYKGYISMEKTLCDG